MNQYLVDYLPAQMNSQIYTYEFDHDANSTSLTWRINHEHYLKSFRRFLLTILGYSKKIYVDSEFFSDLASPHIFSYENTLESTETLDELIIIGLRSMSSVIISLPDEEVLLHIGSMNILIETDNEEQISFYKDVATANGLYIRFKSNDGL